MHVATDSGALKVAWLVATSCTWLQTQGSQSSLVSSNLLHVATDSGALKVAWLVATSCTWLLAGALVLGSIVCAMSDTISELILKQ